MVPQDLRRRIALRQTVDMVRVTMEFFEEVVPLLARTEEQLIALTAGILRYSRDLAFAAASAYADAAEARGAWDTRMEANVVDAVVRGDTGPDLLSRAAALNWDATAPATVLVGTARAPGRVDARQPMTSTTSRNATAARRCPTCTAPGWSRSCPAGCRRPTSSWRELLDVFADGPVVIGPTAPTLDRGAHSATEAIAGMNAVAGWRGAPRPVPARELLPERALLGDATAVAALDTEVMRPLADAGPALTDTLDAYLDSGGADRGLRTQVVRSSKYRALPPQTDRRVHRPRSDEAARRVRAAGGRHRGPIDAAKPSTPARRNVVMPVTLIAVSTSHSWRTDTRP